MRKVVVIGAGIGGLTTAAVLAKAGLDVTVLESHVYPGGCAGTFYHQGYRFDAGATMSAGFYPGGPMDLVMKATGVDQWPGRTADLAMCVHLPDGAILPRYASELRRKVCEAFFSPQDQVFWEWQEQTADALWDLALRLPAWPPQDVHQVFDLFRKGAGWLLTDLRRFNPGLFLDAFQPVEAHLRDASERLRLFVDAQLLISAQTTSLFANALYAASALDLPRRGVIHLEGGMGAIAQKLVRAIQRNGGRVLYRKQVVRILLKDGHPLEVATDREQVFPADLIVANLTPWNLRRLLGERANPSLQKLPKHPDQGWGAFTVYAGIEDTAVPQDFPLHHQVVLREPFGEGNTVFLSISPDWDVRRAPPGSRAVTISTHTELQPWWTLYENDRQAYEIQKERYTQRLLQAAEAALPGLGTAVKIVLPGTPISFQKFTQRDRGWVGGFPQVNLFRVWGSRQQPGIWMVGDSIFPGQSTAAAALGGLSTAYQILNNIPVPKPQVVSPGSPRLQPSIVFSDEHEINRKDT